MATSEEFHGDIAHLLRRAGVGGSPNEVSALAQYPLASVVEMVLDETKAPTFDPPASALVVDTGQPYASQVETVHWWLDRMAKPQAPIVEKMTVFWHNHFVSSIDKISFTNMWRQIDIFRKKGLGSFTELTQAVAVSPAMLHYLDNRDNRVTGINENFARELMELFTMGQGPTTAPNYTQEDIVAVAKAWTGHGTGGSETPEALRPFVYTFHSARHDNSLKTIFGITKNWNGPDVINEICLGSKKDATARFIATKVWTWFAYPNPEPAIVTALATAFKNGEPAVGSTPAKPMHIKSLLRAMFLRPEFYSVTAKQGHVRTPAEFMAATIRYLNVPAVEVKAYDYQASMGQVLYRPPNVAGWKPNEEWLSTSTVWGRSRFARAMATKAVAKNMLLGNVTDTSLPLTSVATMVQRTFDLLGIDKPSEITRSAMVAMAEAERAAKGTNEKLNLITLGLLSPDFQVA